MKSILLACLFTLNCISPDPPYESWVLTGKTIAEVRRQLDFKTDMILLEHDSEQTMSIKAQKAFYMHSLRYMQKETDREVTYSFDMNDKCWATSIGIFSHELNQVIKELDMSLKRDTSSIGALMWKWSENGYVSITRKESTSNSMLFYTHGNGF